MGQTEEEEAGLRRGLDEDRKDGGLEASDCSQWGKVIQEVKSHPGM